MPNKPNTNLYQKIFASKTGGQFAPVSGGQFNRYMHLDEQYASKLRKKESEFRESTATRKGVNTIMLTTWGISGSHSVGLVTHSITKACFFD